MTRLQLPTVIALVAVVSTACAGVSTGDDASTSPTTSLTSTTSASPPTTTTTTNAPSTKQAGTSTATTTTNTTALATSEPESDTSGALPLTKDALAVIRAISRFVERERGLDFKDEVEVLLLDQDAFIEAYKDAVGGDDPTDDDAERSGGFATNEAVLRAFGLLEDLSEDSTLEAEYVEYSELAILGFYNLEDDLLVIRTQDLTPYMRGVLAHELAHALDDQWFDLYRPDIEVEVGDEARWAFRALVEGNAQRIQLAYMESRSKSEQDVAEEESDAISEKIEDVEIPDIVEYLTAAPYIYGQVFVEGLLLVGGQRLLDEAFENPPTTSEHVLNLQAYRNGVQPEGVRTPPADGRVIDSGVIGQHLMFVIVGQALGYDDSIAPIQGWAGDAYVAWEVGDGSTCVRFDVATDGPSELDALESTLRRWARSQPDAVSGTESGGLIRTTSCR